MDQDGQVKGPPALTTETDCDFKLLRFPRDQRDCTLGFMLSAAPGSPYSGTALLPSCLLPLSSCKATAPDSQGPAAVAGPLVLATGLLQLIRGNIRKVWPRTLQTCWGPSSLVSSPTLPASLPSGEQHSSRP